MGDWMVARILFYFFFVEACGVCVVEGCCHVMRSQQESESKQESSMGGKWGKGRRRKETPTYSRNGGGAWKLGYRDFVLFFCTGNGEFHSLFLGMGNKLQFFLHLGSEFVFLLGVGDLG
jgi:hypothetical protein